MAKQNLLLVDADLRSLRVLEVSLRKAGYNVASIGNARDALAMLEQSRPDLVLCDTRLPGMDGFELIQEIRKRPDIADVPLMVLSSDVSVETKVRGLQLGVEDYLTKPIYIKELLARVGIVLQRKRREGIEHLEYGNKRRFSGALADMGVVDLLQAVDHNKKSGVLYLKSDGSEGAIYFCNGAPVDAAVGRLHGTRAIYRTLLWTEGTFEIDFREIDREDHVQTSMQALLMEGLRRVDEWGRLLEQLPDMDTVFEVSETQLFSRLAEIPDQINAVLREFDGERSLWQIVDACDGDDLETLNAVSKLYFEGLLYNTGRHANDPKPKPRPREAEPEPTEIAMPHISSGPPVITHTLAPAWPSVPSDDGDQPWTRVDQDTFQLNIPSTPRVPEEAPASPSQAPRRRKARKRKRRGASQSLSADAMPKRAAREADDSDVHDVDESVAEITPSTIAPPPEDAEATAFQSVPAKVASVPPPLPATSKPSKPASWPSEPNTSEVSLAQLTDASSESDALHGRDAEVLSDDAAPGDVTAAPPPRAMTPPPLNAAGQGTPPPRHGVATQPPLMDAANFTVVPGSAAARAETARPLGVRTLPPLTAASVAPPGPTTLRPDSAGYRDTEQGLQPAAAGEHGSTMPPADAEAEAADSRPPLGAASEGFAQLDADAGEPLDARRRSSHAESAAPASSPPARSVAPAAVDSSAPLDIEATLDLRYADAPTNASTTKPPLDGDAGAFADAPPVASATIPPRRASQPASADAPATASATFPPLDADEAAFADAPAMASPTIPPPDADDAALAASPAMASPTIPPPDADDAALAVAVATQPPRDADDASRSSIAPATIPPLGASKPPLDAEAAADLSIDDVPAIASATNPPLDAEAAPDLSLTESTESAGATSPPLDAEAAPDLSFTDLPAVASGTTPPLDAESVPDLSFADSAALAPDTHRPLDAEAATDLSLSDSPPLGTAIHDEPAVAAGSTPPVARASSASPPPIKRSSASPPPLPSESKSQQPESEKPAPSEVAASLLSSASEALRKVLSRPPSTDPMASEPPAISAATGTSIPVASGQPPDFDAAAARLASAKVRRGGAESLLPLTSINPSLRHQGPPPGAPAQPMVTAKPPPFAAVPSVSQSPSGRASLGPQHRTDTPPPFSLDSANDNASQPAPDTRSEPAAEGGELNAFAKAALGLHNATPDVTPANDTQPAADDSVASRMLSAALSASTESSAKAQEAIAKLDATEEQAPAPNTLSQMPTGEIAAVAPEPTVPSKAPNDGVWTDPAKALSTAAPAPAKRRSTRWMQVGSIAAATALAAGLYALRARDAVPQGSLIRAVPKGEIAAKAPEPPSEPKPTPAPPEAPQATASPEPERAAGQHPAKTDMPGAETAKKPEPETVEEPEAPKPPVTPNAEPTVTPPAAAASAAQPTPPPADAKQVMAKGRSLEQKGKKKDALELYEKTVADGGGSSELLSHMAFLYLNQGNNARAEANALKASEADETNSEAWIVLGAARAGLGKKQAADEAYRSCANKGQGQYVTECRRMLR